MARLGLGGGRRVLLSDLEVEVGDGGWNTTSEREEAMGNLPWDLEGAGERATVAVERRTRKGRNAGGRDIALTCDACHRRPPRALFFPQSLCWKKTFRKGTRDEFCGIRSSCAEVFGCLSIPFVISLSRELN